MNSQGLLEKQPQANMVSLAILSAAAVFLCAVGCEPGQARRQLQKGADQLAKGDYSLARDHYTQALKLNPRSAAAYLGRGKSHEGLASPADAVNDYEHALELQPDLAEAQERLIYLLVEMEEGRKALNHFASLPPSALTPSLLLLRGRARMQLEHASDAIADFDSVLKLEPQNVSAYYYRGLAQAKLGRLLEAEKDFTAAIFLDAGQASAYWQRGLVRERRGMKDLAASDRQKAAELDPRLNFAESQMGKKMIESLTGKGGDDAQLEFFSK